jgi:hypothetical protein
MDCRQLISTIIGHLAWPIVTLIIAFFFKEKVNEALDKLKSLKYGAFEVTFAEISKKLITKEISEEEKTRLLRQQIVYETPYYKLYSNGSLIQHLKDITILGNTGSKDLTFPITFPNELTGIQVIGDIDVKVTKASLGSCTISFTPASKERQLTLILSGL